MYPLCICFIKASKMDVPAFLIHLLHGIGNCSYGSGALFYGIGNCSYSGGTPTRIALAILGVQSAGFALFYFLVC
jgi:hypothetical protein